jgi:hypothetical protein
MGLYVWNNLLDFIGLVILVGLFGATSVHIQRGSKLKNVSVMARLLLAANIFAVA